MLPQYNEELIRTLQNDKDNDSCYLIKLMQIKLKSMRARFIDDEIVTAQIDEVLELGERLIDDGYISDLEAYFKENESTILDDEDKLDTYMNLSIEASGQRAKDYREYFNLLGEYSDYWWDVDD